MTTNEIMAMAREAGFRTGQINLSNGPPVPFITPASGTNCMGIDDAELHHGIKGGQHGTD